MTPNLITTHPGEILREEFLVPLRLSVNALATALRVPATRIGAIVKGERGVSADTAMRLARYFAVFCSTRHKKSHCPAPTFRVTAHPLDAAAGA
jgi:addiction module HigA family antidote